MIAKLTGNIDEVGENWLIIDIQGVGYFVNCSSRTLRAIGGLGESVSLYIDPLFRQESLQLYGFESVSERDSFRLLLSVQGVGARMALSILSLLSSEELAQAIASKDSAKLQQASGVGGKLATRILNELKDKVKSVELPTSLPSAVFSLLPHLEDAVSALIHLGYKRSEAISAATKAEASHENASLQEIIRLSLSYLGKGV